MTEQRRYARTPIHAALTFFVKGQPQPLQGIGKDISLGGMFIQTAQPAPFGAEVILHVELPGASEPFALPGVVRWMRSDGMGVQFGLLGAMETHFITEIGRAYGEKAG